MRAWMVGVASLVLVGCTGEGSDGVEPPPPPAGASSGTSTGGAGGMGEGGATTSTTGGGGPGGSGGAGAGGQDPGWGPDQCPAPPAGVEVGVEVGDQLLDIVVKNCAGEDVSLTQFCGANGLFIFAAHGWCPLCQSVSEQMEAMHDSFAGQGLASVNIVVATGANEPPDADYCALWRQEHGHEDVVTLFDPTGEVLQLWSATSSLSAFIDQDRVIVSKLEHTSNIDAIKAGIQGALDK